MRNMVITFLALVFLCPTATLANPGKPISISGKEIREFLPGNPELKKFGDLEFLGGLVLSSQEKGFGGLSGIRIQQGKSFIAITDKGMWITGEIVREGTRPVAIRDARAGQLRNASGKRLKGKRNADAEGIEIDGQEFLISFERNDRVQRFAFRDDKLISTSDKPVIRFQDAGLYNNKGPEGIALAPQGSPVAGSLIVLPELAINADNNTRAFIVTDGERRDLAIKGVNGFGITDAAFMPNGDLLVLERKYSLLTGLGIRLTKYEASLIGEDSVMEGQTLLDVSGDHEIDNMEGIAVSPMPDGSTRITLVSDDNFADDQRTLLLEFRYKAN